MTDLHILLVAVLAAAALWGYLELCDRVHGMILDLVAGLMAVFVFVYLLWALLRPEDF